MNAQRNIELEEADVDLVIQHLEKSGHKLGKSYELKLRLIKWKNGFEKPIKVRKREMQTIPPRYLWFPNIFELKVKKAYRENLYTIELRQEGRTLEISRAKLPDLKEQLKTQKARKMLQHWIEKYDSFIEYTKTLKDA